MEDMHRAQRSMEDLHRAQRSMEELHRTQVPMNHLEYLKKTFTMTIDQVDTAVLPDFFRWVDEKKAEFKCRKYMHSGLPSYPHGTGWAEGAPQGSYRMSPDTTVQTEALELTKSPEKKAPKHNHPQHPHSYMKSHHDAIAYPKESGSVPYKSHHSPVYGSEASGIMNLSVKSEANTNVATSPVLKVPSFYNANSPAKPVATSPPPPPPIKSEIRKAEIDGYSNLRSLLEANKISDMPVASSLCASPAKSSDAEASIPSSPDSKDQRKGQTECNICQKRFQYRSSYRRHMRIHQGIYTHICGFCQRKFTRKEHFDRHKCNRKPNIPNRSANRVELTPEARLPSDRIPQPKVAFPPTFNRSVAAAMCSPSKSVDEHFMQTAYSSSAHSSTHPQPHVEHLPAAVCNESRRKKAQPRKLVVEEDLSSTNGYMDEEDDEVLKAYESPVHTPGSSDSLHSNPSSPQDLSMPDHSKSSAVQDLSTFNHYEQPMETDTYQQPKPIVITPDTISTTTGTYQIEQGNEEDKCIKVTKQSNYLKLRNEAQTVNGKTEFRCPVCSKVFFRSSNFSRHMRLHRGVFSYMCKACNRGFYRKEHCDKHKCSHRGMPAKNLTSESSVPIPTTKSDDNGNEHTIRDDDIPEGAEEGIDLRLMEGEDDQYESEEEEEEGNLVVDESAVLSEEEEDLNSPLPPPVVRS